MDHYIYKHSYYEGDEGEYSFAPYYNRSYLSTPNQGSYSYSIKSFNESTPFFDAPSSFFSYPASNFSQLKFVEHYGPASTTNQESFFNGNNGFYEPAPFVNASKSLFAYSVSNFSDPKCIEYYDPAPSQTQFIISYSVSEFNEPEFQEYDPTPYGGGYDMDATYGKAFSPSTEICYPRSTTGSHAPATSGNIVSTLPITAPHKEEEEGEEVNKDVPINHEEPENEPLSNGDGRKLQEKSTDNGWSGYDKVVNQVPSGYGLEAMDLCESLFGYWPCLARHRRESDGYDRQGIGAESGGYEENQWNAADYLFGNSNPYNEIRGDNVIYGYERHHLRGPLSGLYNEEVYNTQQVESVEDSGSS